MQIARFITAIFLLFLSTSAGVAAQTRESLAGTWTGMMTEIDDGVPFTYPIEVTIEPGLGIYRATLAAEVTMQTPQGPLRARIRASYSGSFNFKKGKYVLKSLHRTMDFPDIPGSSQEMMSGKLRFHIFQGELVGEEGNFLEGWSKFRLTRQR